MKSLPLVAALCILAGPVLAQTDHQHHHAPGAPTTPSQSQPSMPMTGPHSGSMPMGSMMPGMSGMTSGRGGAMGGSGMMSGGSGTSAGSSMSGGSCMSGSGGMGCSMMQGGMMGGRTAAGAATNRDESVPSLAFRAVNEKMHRDMAVEFTGNVDVDFTKAMIAHHQGAIDMAKIAVAFGKDPQIRRLAEEVIKTQEAEIATMRDWLRTNAK